MFTKVCGARQSSVNSRERKSDLLCGVLLTLKFMISIRKLYCGRCGYYVDIRGRKWKDEEDLRFSLILLSSEW